jgi:tRNA(fMet)-specific endonuclease VapC
LTARLEAAGGDHALTVITVEEQMRGWLAEIHRHPDLNRQIIPYGKLQRQVELLAEWIILPWDAEAAASFTRFRREGVRIGSLDLKIACIALAYDVTLLTRNTSDFAHVPGLRFENWLE